MSRRRRAVRARRRGGSKNVWQIIYIDLMTTMMVFFVILWSVDQSDDNESETHTGISDTIGDQSARMVNLPGDVLFASGQTEVSQEGQAVFRTLFGDGGGNSSSSGSVLEFDMGGVAHRQLVIHGHTDSDGDKDKNFALGYARAFSVYKQIARYGDDVPDHIVLCTHADNSPKVATPQLTGTLSDSIRAEIAAAKAKNRRISIEDQVIGSNK